MNTHTVHLWHDVWMAERDRARGNTSPVWIGMNLESYRLIPGSDLWNRLKAGSQRGMGRVVCHYYPPAGWLASHLKY